MKLKKYSRLKLFLPILLIMADVFFACMALFDKNATTLGKMLYFLILELTLPTNLFTLRTVIAGIENAFEIFFKGKNSKIFLTLVFVNFDFIVLSIVFAFTTNIYFLFGLILPSVHFLIFAMMWKYCNYDSEKITKLETNKYLGVGINGHYVFDGVDILSEKNYKKSNFQKHIKLVNPFNSHFSFVSKELLYVTGKSYKFYVSTYKIDEQFTLLFFSRNKDVVRSKLNKQLKQDFELNKNIYTAYCLNEEKKLDDFVYIENRLRYKIINSNAKNCNVVIEQKMELPHLNSQNKISNWFGDSFNFPGKNEADMFVKFVIEQTKNSSTNNEI